MSNHYIPDAEWGKKHPKLLCGAQGTGYNTDIWVNCPACLSLLEARPPLHTPPLMNENEDGLFIFHDRWHGPEYTMELAPQSTGNIEITLEGPHGDGHIFALSHLDRADMIRALLHEFHYSPERGGPNDIDS